MDIDRAREWFLFAAAVLAQVFALGFIWSRLLHRVNGLGRRVHLIEGAFSRMDRIEKELAEYRADLRDAAKGLARTEKGLADVNENINNLSLQLGSQLHGIERLIQDKDKSTSNRLVRIETLQRIEQKIGPLEETG